MREEIENKLLDVVEGAVFEHTKTGNLYDIITVGKNVNQSGQFMVVYKNPKTAEIWIRPVEDFFADVDLDGYTVPRFRPFRARFNSGKI